MKTILLLIIPASLVSALYLLFLGHRIQKDAWSDHLIVNGPRTLKLELSEDAWGMVWVGIGGVLILIGVVGVRGGIERIGNANGK